MTPHPNSEAAKRAARAEIDPVDFERPVKGRLMVKLENGEEWEATTADLDRFRVVRRLDAYVAVMDTLRHVLTRAGLMERGDVTDCEINPLRHLVETAVMYPQLLDHPENEGWAGVVEIERRLRTAAAIEPST